MLVGSKPATNDASCGMPCEGDKEELCGGRAVLSVFKKNNAAVSKKAKRRGGWGKGRRGGEVM